MELLIMGAAALTAAILNGGVMYIVARNNKNHGEQWMLEKKISLNEELENRQIFDMDAEFELQILNTLYICNNCERFTRQHIMELEMLKTELRTMKKPVGCCPNCKSTNYTEARESFSWQKKHRHCYAMDQSQFFEHKDLVKRVREQIKHAEEMKAFEQYETKHLANSMEHERYFKEFDEPAPQKELKLTDTGFKIDKYLEKEKPPQVNSNGLTPEEEAAKTMAKLKASPEGREYLKPEPFNRPIFPGMKEVEQMSKAVGSFGIKAEEFEFHKSTLQHHDTSIRKRHSDDIETLIYLAGDFYKIKWDEKKGRNVYVDEGGRRHVFSQAFINAFRGAKKEGMTE